MRMDSGTLEREVRLVSVDGKESKGTVRIQHWNRHDRLVRAAKFGGASLGLAIVSVFIPLLHFVLVPLFLLATPFVFSLTFNRESAVLGGEGACPKCGEPFTVAKGPNKFPLKDLCTRCYGAVEVHVG